MCRSDAALGEKSNSQPESTACETSLLQVYAFFLILCFFLLFFNAKDLPKDVRAVKLKELAGLEMKSEERKQQERDKKITLKYRTVRFFGTVFVICPHTS